MRDLKGDSDTDGLDCSFEKCKGDYAAAIGYGYTRAGDPNCRPLALANSPAFVYHSTTFA